jgi:hypothetical protein
LAAAAAPTGGRSESATSTTAAAADILRGIGMSDIELAKNIGFGVVAVGLGMAVVMFAEHIARWLLGL